MMTPRDEAWFMHNDFRALALKEGNEPILCSRMHFAQWADRVDAMFRHIVKLEDQLDVMRELERQRWESAAKTFGLSRETRNDAKEMELIQEMADVDYEYDMGHDYDEDIERDATPKGPLT